MFCIYGDGVGSAVEVRRIRRGYHERQLEAIGESISDGGAEVAGRIADKERRLGWCQMGRGDY